MKPETRPGARQIIDRQTLKFLIQQMNRALRDSEGGGLMERFEAISKLLFTRIVDEREVLGRWHGGMAKAVEEFRRAPGETDRVVYERARAIWQRAISAYPQLFPRTRAQFPPDVAAVARIADILGPVSLSETPDDIKGGVYEEMLRNTFEKSENQQYFTPRQIVDFTIAMAAPTATDAVCDPACGSGGFLVGALAFVQHRDGDATLLASKLRGTEIDERMAWVARINLLMHGGDPRAIHHMSGAGALAPLPQLRAALPHGAFDLILTNPPFGSDMNDRAALQGFETGQGRASRRRGVLFVEQCLKLLKPGGRLAVVLDDGILNLPANSDIRALIRREAIVEAVISLPDVTFMPYATVKTSILLVRRRSSTEERQGPTLMADVEHVGNRPNGDPLYADGYDESGRRRIKTDLPFVLSCYRRFAAGQVVNEAHEGTSVFCADIDAYANDNEGNRLDVFFYHPARLSAQRRLANAAYPLMRLVDLVAIVADWVTPAEEFGDSSIRWIGLGDLEAGNGRFEIRDLPGDRIKSEARQHQPGDILFSRLRPKLRKVILIPPDEEPGVCSAELLVLRLRPEYADRVSRAYLAYLLRSELVYGQLVNQITGVGRPRVSIHAVRQLRLPIPPLEVQRDLVGNLSASARMSERLQGEAAQLLDRAVRQTEEAYTDFLSVLCPQPATRAHATIDNPGGQTRAW